jgi:hypothetical protein
MCECVTGENGLEWSWRDTGDWTRMKLERHGRQEMGRAEERGEPRVRAVEPRETIYCIYRLG